jgi:hypothetical protein
MKRLFIFKPDKYHITITMNHISLKVVSTIFIELKKVFK